MRKKSSVKHVHIDRNSTLNIEPFQLGLIAVLSGRCHFSDLVWFHVSKPLFCFRSPHKGTQYSSEYLFITLMCSSTISHSRHKRSFMCHSVPVSLYAFFNPLKNSNFKLIQRNKTASLTRACSQTMYFYAENVFNAYVKYEQILSTTSKCNTLLWLTVTEHIFFAPLIATQTWRRNGQKGTLSNPTD